MMEIEESSYEELAPGEQEGELEEEVRTPFTKWVNEPTLEDLKQDLSDASGDHEAQVQKINGWLENLNITGKAKRKKKKGKSVLVPKLIRKQAEWRYASLSEPFLSTEDVFNVDPVTFEDRDAAQQNSLVLNNQFNTKLQKVKFIDEYIRTAVDEGTVIVRTGWDFQEEEQLVPVEVPVMGQVPVQDPQQAHMMQMQGMPPVEEGQIGVREEMQPQMVTIVNKPTVDVCKYTDVIIDPTCQGDLQKANFIIYRFETSKAELEKSGKYKNLERISVEDNSILGAPDDSIGEDEPSSFQFNDEPRKKIYAYEYWGYWDINDEGVVEGIVATWVGDTMIRMEENPFPDQELPFISVQYLPVRKKIYGEPDGELLEDNQLVIGAVTRGVMDMMGRSANGQTGSRKDALDVTNKRKYDRGEDYEFNPAIQDPRNAFFMHTYPEIPQSAQYILQSQNAEAESLTGVKAFNSGISGAALGDNATGIRSALDATSKRELGILRRLAEGMKQTGRKIISMNGEFLEEGEVVRITEEEFIPVRPDDLAGNFDLSLTISTAEADNDKAKELSFMLQTMGPQQDPVITKMIQSDIARLRKMPDLAKRIEEYEPEPDPLMVKKAELEIALLEAQIVTEQAKSPEKQGAAMLSEAKAGTEVAKTRLMGSEADLKDLDFVEEEGGAKHAREMQKAGAQAGANRSLKADEHAYKMREEALKGSMKPKASNTSGAV